MAKRLGWDFLDLDQEIEKTAGMSVSDIFGNLGEPEFRIFESQSLSETSQQTHTVIACGGGVVTRPENIEYLKKELTVWLDISPEAAAKRLEYADDRPLLTECKDTLLQLGKILNQRRDAYEKSARIRINADQELAEKVVEDIVKALKDIDA
ncbi:MAG: shikimate kinase [Candidatus Marinimicrobia bacterium]|nr:shikimate kinase [Candidatus Neomarinimicrobiota bacterium]